MNEIEIPADDAVSVRADELLDLVPVSPVLERVNRAKEIAVLSAVSRAGRGLWADAVLDLAAAARLDARYEAAYDMHRRYDRTR